MNPDNRVKYCHDFFKDGYIDELESNCDIFINSIYLVLNNKMKVNESNVKKELKKYNKRQTLYVKYRLNHEQINLPKDFVVPEEYELDFISESYQSVKYSIERQYQLAFSNIVMLWEMQLFEYCLAIYKKQKNHFDHLINTSIKHTNIQEVDLVKIKEIRHVVNVIKHGQCSNSYKELVNIDSKYLEAYKNEDEIAFNERYYLEIGRAHV